MLKTTIGKSHEEVIKLPRNRTKAEVNLLDKYAYYKFKKKTGCKNISIQTRNAVIKKINERIMATILQGHYNVRIPNLGIITLIKHKAKGVGYGAKTKKGDLVPKVHIYFQVTGDERRVYVYDFDFISTRKHKRLLQKLFPAIADTVKESK